MARNILNEIADYLEGRKTARESGERIPKPVRFPFTAARIDSLRPADSEYIVHDEKQAGLECRVLPTGAKSLQVNRRPAGSSRMVRIKISTVADQLPLDGKDGVRSRVRSIIGQLEQGENPNELERVRKAQEAAELVTLQQALEAYLSEVTLAPRTIDGYRGQVRHHFADWRELPLHQVTPEMVVARHRKISAKHPSAANNAVRVLRLLFEHNELDWTRYRRRMKKQWHREQRRTNYVAPTSLKDWWAATEAIAETRKGTRRESVPVYPHGELWRDFFQFLILTGLRRRECSHKLLWENIDLKAATFTIYDTKNHGDHTLPLSDYLIDILKRRKIADPKASHPFPIDEPKKAVVWIVEKSGVPFSSHDLRRSFLTYAELMDYGLLTLKAFANHRSTDVTSGYVLISVERLREPMQRITDYVLKNAGVKESAAVITLADKRNV